MRNIRYALFAQNKKCLPDIHVYIYTTVQTEESSQPSEFKNIGIPLSKRFFF